MDHQPQRLAGAAAQRRSAYSLVDDVAGPRERSVVSLRYRYELASIIRRTGHPLCDHPGDTINIHTN
jgi:hypothetical protein